MSTITIHDALIPVSDGTATLMFAAGHEAQALCTGYDISLSLGLREVNGVFDVQVTARGPQLAEDFVFFVPLDSERMAGDIAYVILDHFRDPQADKIPD
jgi:hypothetical protein